MDLLLQPTEEILDLNEGPSTATSNMSNQQTIEKTQVEVLQKRLEEVLEENARLKQELDKNVTENNTLREKCEIFEMNSKQTDQDFEKKIKTAFADILTPNQVEIVLKKKTRARWTTEELGRAFTIRYFSKRCYIFLRGTLKYPLPGISTLQRWAANMNLKRGILHDILKVMETVGSATTDEYRVTVLSYDEMKVCSIVEYDQKNDEVLGPHNYVQVIMARGLFGKWKQPIFVAFDTSISKKLLQEVITELHNIKYNVVACVSDCGGSNQGLWKALDININNSSFLHPITQEKVHMFADAPHLLKLIRNWFVDTGFQLEDGTVLKVDLLEQLITHTNTEISSCFKLTPEHIHCEKSQRQNVALAAQLFSHTSATALKRYFSGENKNLAEKLADFVELIDNWRNIMNSYTPSESLQKKRPYGMVLKSQDETLNTMKKVFSTLTCCGKKSLQVFQKAIIISITSLQNLFTEIRAKYAVKYILTHRVNQDCLENLFSQVNITLCVKSYNNYSFHFILQIRTRGGLHDHPSPLSVLYRLRMILLGKNPGVVQSHTNVQHHESSREEYFIVSQAFTKAQIERPVLTDPRCSELPDDLSETSSSTSTSSLTPQTSQFTSNIEKMSESDGLMYVAGYLARKHRDQFPDLGSYTYKEDSKNIHSYSMPSWVQQLSFGGLTQPSEEWMKNVEKMETFFNKFHKGTLRTGKNIVIRTHKYISKKCPNVPQILVKSFSKQRIFIRIKYLNCQRKLAQGVKRKSSEDLSRKVLTKVRKIVQ